MEGQTKGDEWKGEGGWRREGRSRRKHRWAEGKRMARVRR